MSKAGHKLITARWFAGDLTDYRLVYPVRLLSVHHHAINLVVNGWPHLLVLSSPALYKGPAVICLEEEGFYICAGQINCLSKGWFRPGSINLSGKEHRLTIDWANCPAYCFAPPPLPVFNPLTINQSLNLLRSWLSRAGDVSSSAALLGAEGGESYFRTEIMNNFPPLVEAAFTGSQQEFAVTCRHLSGLGRGATPTGDDLIHGALIACRYYFHSCRIPWIPPHYPPQLGSSTTLLGAHMLDIAHRGLTIEPVRSLLSGIFTGYLTPGCLRLLLEVGSSTGYDLAAAIFFTLSRLLAVC